MKQSETAKDGAIVLRSDKRPSVDVERKGRGAEAKAKVTIADKRRIDGLPRIIYIRTRTLLLLCQQLH